MGGDRWRKHAKQDPVKSAVAGYYYSTTTSRPSPPSLFGREEGAGRVPTNVIFRQEGRNRM